MLLVHILHRLTILSTMFYLAHLSEIHGTAHYQKIIAFYAINVSSFNILIIFAQRTEQNGKA